MKKKANYLENPANISVKHEGSLAGISCLRWW